MKKIFYLFLFLLLIPAALSIQVSTDFEWQKGTKENILIPTTLDDVTVNLVLKDMNEEEIERINDLPRVGETYAYTYEVPMNFEHEKINLEVEVQTIHGITTSKNLIYIKNASIFTKIKYFIKTYFGI